MSAELEAHKDELTPEMATELAGLIKRLETVTCRLEATASGGGPAGPCGPAPGAAPTMDAGEDEIILGVLFIAFCYIIISEQNLWLMLLARQHLLLVIV